jgi:hypothetical protein
MTKNKRIMTINIMNEQLQNKSNHGGGECNVLERTITTAVKRFRYNDYNDKQTITEHRSDAQQTTDRTNNTMAIYHRRLLNDKVSLEGIVEV